MNSEPRPAWDIKRLGPGEYIVLFPELATDYDVEGELQIPFLSSLGKNPVCMCGCRHCVRERALRFRTRAAAEEALAVHLLKEAAR